MKAFVIKHLTTRIHRGTEGSSKRETKVEKVSHTLPSFPPSLPPSFFSQGKKAGLYPKDDDFKALLVDEIVGAVEDVIAATVPSLKEADEEVRLFVRAPPALLPFLPSPSLLF